MFRDSHEQKTIIAYHLVLVMDGDVAAAPISSSICPGDYLIDRNAAFQVAERAGLAQTPTARSRHVNHRFQGTRVGRQRRMRWHARSARALGGAAIVALRKGTAFQNCMVSPSNFNVPERTVVLWVIMRIVEMF